MIDRIAIHQRIKSGVMQHRLAIDTNAFPDPILVSWCGATLSFDWDNDAMMAQLATFLTDHQYCFPGECKESERERQIQRNLRMYRQ